MTGKMEPIELEHGKHNQSEYKFLMVCSYLNIVNNLRIVLLQIKTSQAVTTSKFCTKNRKKYVIFIGLCMKANPFASIKGK